MAKDHSPHAIGIDIGGTGIKGAVVELGKGKLLTERHKRSTPPGGSPEAIAATTLSLYRDIHAEFGSTPGTLPVGVSVPSVVKHGVTSSAANIAQEWIDLDAGALFEHALGLPVTLVNDADAAGIGEVRFGAAKRRRDTVLVITLGTGIGSALIHDGRLFPNTELGHLELDGQPDYERFASARAREVAGLDFPAWGERLTRYFGKLEALFAPDLFVISGGISKRADEFLHLIDVATPLVPAKLRNNAGIVGAAALADEGWH